MVYLLPLVAAISLTCTHRYRTTIPWTLIHADGRSSTSAPLWKLNSHHDSRSPREVTAGVEKFVTTERTTMRCGTWAAHTSCTNSSQGQCTISYPKKVSDAMASSDATPMLRPRDSAVPSSSRSMWKMGMLSTYQSGAASAGGNFGYVGEC